MRTIRALIPIAAACVFVGGVAAAHGQEPGDLPEPPPASDEEIYQGTCGHLGMSCERSDPGVELELLTRPVHTGTEVRVRFRAKFTEGGAPVQGARVSLAGGSASTDRRGRVAVATALVRPGRYRARLSSDDVPPASVMVVVVERSR